MLKKDLDELDKEGKKGDWCFLYSNTCMVIRYGEDKLKDIVIIPISLENSDIAWKWNGSEEEPTVEPSILVHPKEGWTNGWHGFLTKGKLLTVK